MSEELHDRYLGCLIGLAVGDALGAPVEFKPAGSFEPITGMRAGGPFDLAKGQWTDDTSMALCIADSLIDKHTFDPVDILTRFVRWYREGYLSSGGTCFDIGRRTRASVEDFEQNCQPFRDPGLIGFASNGSIMRLAPIPMAYRTDPEKAIRYAGDSSRLTHNHPDAVDACRYLAALIVGALNGTRKEVLLQPFYSPAPSAWEQEPLSEKMAILASGNYLKKDFSGLHSAADAVLCLEAALWVFAHTDTFREGCLKVVNMGDDSDTTGAVYGQLASAYYGYAAIPEEWLADLVKSDLLLDTAQKLILLGDLIT